MENDLVSILMCVYDEKDEYIVKAIESIINQTYKNMEIIIVCDNPTNSRIKKLLGQYKIKDNRIKIIINKENIGLSLSLNKAISVSNGKYIARMDADDISILDRIKFQKEYLIDNGFDIIGSGVVCINEDGETINVLNRYPTTSKRFLKKILYSNCMPHPTWFGKREVFINNNGYRNIPYAEDFDFILRGLKLGYRMGNIKKVLLKYRIRDNSISKSNGLKQYITFCELLNYYKKDDLKDIEKIQKLINKEISKLNNLQCEDYQKASSYFLISSNKFSNKNVIGLVYLVKAICKSKFYRKKIYSYFKGIIW